VIRTNLDSMFTCTRPLIDGMRSRGFGRAELGFRGADAGLAGGRIADVELEDRDPGLGLEGLRGNVGLP
jgi:hypothetical protein